MCERESEKELFKIKEIEAAYTTIINISDTHLLTIADERYKIQWTYIYLCRERYRYTNASTVAKVMLWKINDSSFEKLGKFDVQSPPGYSIGSICLSKKLDQDEMPIIFVVFQNEAAENLLVQLDFSCRNRFKLVSTIQKNTTAKKQCFKQIQ